MGQHQLILAKAPKAAAMMSMTQARFIALVEAGSLPKPVLVVGMREPRWRVSDLESVGTGAAMEEDGEW